MLKIVILCLGVLEEEFVPSSEGLEFAQGKWKY